MKVITVKASSFARLDSSVTFGGGTDETAAFQAVLDQAKDDNVGLHIVMDGAALVSQLVLYSDTTIECLNRDCGFFQKNGSDRALVTNGNWNMKSVSDHDITLTGGTYNQNAPGQKHHVPMDDSFSEESKKAYEGMHCTFAFEFYGVGFLTLRDLNIVDFRTYALAVGGFHNVLVENVWLSLPNKMHAQNQDGFHFWGPGQFLTVKNCGGDVGDDFMNIGPDELDYESDITDVLVDGIMLHHADQAIRLLTRWNGKLDRVTIRNITGTYRSFGFYVNCWMPSEKYGCFKNIFFENIDLRPEKPNYDYREPFLFSIGGNVECLTIKNVRVHQNGDARPLIELGLPFYEITRVFPEDNMPKFENFILDGLTADESAESKPMDYIRVFEPIDRLVIRDAFIVRDASTAPAGHLVAFRHQGRVGTLYMNNVVANGFASLIDDETKIGRILATSVVNEK